MKTVYWSFSLGDTLEQTLPTDYTDPPEKFGKDYDKGYQHAMCPAWKEYGKNTWLVKSPFDIKFTVESQTKIIHSPLTPEAKYSLIDQPPDWFDNEYPEIQFKYLLSLWTKDKDVWVEQVPHPLLSRYGLELVPATFPISVWFRPLSVGVKVLDVNEQIFIPKGLPLYYFRLYSQRSRSNFKIEYAPPTKEKVSGALANMRLKIFSKFDSWGLIENRVKEESKCPFKFMWNK